MFFDNVGVDLKNSVHVYLYYTYFFPFIFLLKFFYLILATNIVFELSLFFIFFRSWNKHFVAHGSQYLIN